MHELTSTCAHRQFCFLNAGIDFSSSVSTSLGRMTALMPYKVATSVARDANRRLQSEKGSLHDGAISAKAASTAVMNSNLPLLERSATSPMVTVR